MHSITLFDDIITFVYLIIILNTHSSKYLKDNKHNNTLFQLLNIQKFNLLI